MDAPVEHPLPATEQHRAELLDLDLRPTDEQVAWMLADQQDAVAAVRAIEPQLARAVDAIAERLAAGPGRLIYVGAGTAGRLGLLDASECPPTFDSERVVGVMAGGGAAMATANEAGEDDAAAARVDLDAHRVGADDAVVGIAASGTTVYTLAAVREARERGALTIGVVNNDATPLARAVDHPLAACTGPELIAGSTRLKAGTAQKIVLNTLSTLVHVRLGHTYGNLMVDLRSSNRKLRERARRIVVDATGVSVAEAEQALDAAEGEHKVAIVALLTGLDAGAARHRLRDADGRIRAAVEG